MLDISSSAGLTPKQRTPQRSSLVKEFKSFSLPAPEFSRAIEEYFIALDTAISLSCLILYRAGEYRQLVSKELDASQYISASRFADDFAAVSFLRKAPFLKTGLDTKKAALDSFNQNEESCKKVNRRFRNLNLDPLFQGDSVLLLEAMRRKVSRFLGRFDVDRMLQLGSWGPGVTTFVKGSDVTSSRKFREENGITSMAYRFLQPYFSSFPHWFTEEKLSSLVVTEVNQVITVPKNAKTDRTIGIEPGINSYFQLGCGRLIRERLRSAGFDLNSDLKNQRGAYKGSFDGSLATVDFSAASDTISKSLVEFLLPDDWLYALGSLRSRSYTLDGHTIPYAKFSAMGNGYTFELESLLFVCAALACCEYLGLPTDEVSVFGDDIIIPVAAMELYASFCSFLGFTVNPRKSFFSGLFRESCGVYYFGGVDCKPLFLKEEIRNAKSIFRLVNSVRSYSHRRGSNRCCDSRFLPITAYLVRRLPATLRVKGPLSAGDAVIASNFDEATPKLHPYGWCGFIHSGFIDVAVEVTDEEPSVLTHKLRYPLSAAKLDEKAVKGSIGNQFSLRSVTRTLFKKSMFASQWYNFGPWSKVLRS